MQNEQKRILVGIPCLEEIKVETCSNLIGYYASARHPAKIHFIRNTYTHYARNQLVYQAVKEKATHLMFIDSDMQFPKNAIDQLVDADKMIVGGMYARRIAPHTPVIKIIENGEFKDILDPEHKLFKVDTIGTGFLLINMKVFSLIDPPFFFHTEPKTFGLKEKPFPNNEVGEDIAFCLKARKAGIEIWCDPTIKIGHVGSKIYYP